jgi:hypothetical protein
LLLRIEGELEPFIQTHIWPRISIPKKKHITSVDVSQNYVYHAIICVNMHSEKWELESPIVAQLLCIMNSGEI